MTAVDRHNKYMQIGRKQRYIEVFQCSADDMSLTLAAPITPTPSLINHLNNIAGLPHPPPQRMPMSPVNANGLMYPQQQLQFPNGTSANGIFQQTSPLFTNGHQGNGMLRLPFMTLPPNVNAQALMNGLACNGLVQNGGGQV
jgi:hypothetical protein